MKKEGLFTSNAPEHLSPEDAVLNDSEPTPEYYIKYLTIRNAS